MAVPAGYDLITGGGFWKLGLDLWELFYRVQGWEAMNDMGHGVLAILVLFKDQHSHGPKYTFRPLSRNMAECPLSITNRWQEGYYRHIVYFCCSVLEIQLPVSGCESSKEIFLWCT